MLSKMSHLRNFEIFLVPRSALFSTYEIFHIKLRTLIIQTLCVELYVMNTVKGFIKASQHWNVDIKVVGMS